MTSELIPAHTQLLLPLLEELKAQGGQARPRDLYDGVAERVGLEPEVRRATVAVGRQNVNLYERRLRWVRQTAVAAGLVATPERGLWSLTNLGAAKLPHIRRGTVVTVLETADGFLLWAWAEDAVAAIEEESVDLIWSSPPYPLNRDIKGYGTMGTRKWVSGMLRLCEQWRSLLTESGSIMLDLGFVYQPGMPSHDLHIERFCIGMEDQCEFQRVLSAVLKCMELFSDIERATRCQTTRRLALCDWLVSLDHIRREECKQRVTHFGTTRVSRIEASLAS